ncbi:helix-turn-helix domain-containing protein [Burkholderia gladioli]|uniref:helix-turn-helix domain-containing protein n=1 Tax=Burkholderia gladioli TaxID=28095 RepID=UPI001641FD6A|nr:helix-turn-helix domain-containing protein [Burkholderia gladioli]MBW5284771.1 DNA-binding protein [Burkholderia gladioli]
MSEIEQLQLIERAVAIALERHAARSPRPSQVTITQAAEMLGISRWTASKMVKSGDLKLNRCGMIPIELVDKVRAVS